MGPHRSVGPGEDDNLIIPGQDQLRGLLRDSEGIPLELLFLMSRTVLPVPPAGVANEVKAALRNVAERIPRLRDRGARISEEDTKRVLITPIIEALGWAIYDTDEVRNEYRHARADNPVDYALFLNRSPVLFIEAKSLGQGLDDRKWLVQTINYANAAGVEWCVLTNGAAFRLYKVHALVEAEQKLFASVSLEDPTNFDGAVRVLSLLTRDNMRARAIDDLWQAWHVDRQVKSAVETVLQEEAFAALLRNRIPQIPASEIKRSLQRANISVDYPNIFAEAAAPTLDIGIAPLLPPASVSPAAEASISLPVSPPHAPSYFGEEQSPGPDPRDSGSSNIKPLNGEADGPRRTLQSTQDLFNLGRLHSGQVLTIRGRAGSEARVIDGRTVEYRGERISFLEWGKRVTGWKAIQIYTAAYTADGRSLDELRDEPQSRPSGR